jgi:hypothetical protein
MAAGLTIEQALLAVEAMEQNAGPTRTARQGRNARYYDKHKDELKAKASEKRLKASETTEASETRPSLNDPLPSSKPLEGNLNPTPYNPPSSKKTKASLREIPAYTPEFEALWSEYPKGAGSKKAAFAEWVLLAAPDHANVMHSLGGFATHREKQSWYSAPHLERYLRDRVFENFLPLAPKEAAKEDMTGVEPTDPVVRPVSSRFRKAYNKDPPLLGGLVMLPRDWVERQRKWIAEITEGQGA